MRVHTIQPGWLFWTGDFTRAEVGFTLLLASDNVKRDDLLVSELTSGRQGVYRFVKCEPGWNSGGEKYLWTLRFVGYADERPVKALLRRAKGLEGEGR